ncbi:MAG TPA: ribose 5-phosphate isomerase B [Anaerolineaceae bacterium]|nr:ribose 5-phosphate isomerase B [Anaerolineaceae bacterium]
MNDREIEEIVRRVVAQSMGLASQTQTAVTPQPTSSLAVKTETTAAPKKVVAIGADHGGFELKELLKPDLASLGFDVIDAGTDNKEAVDYPDFALAVASMVSTGKAWRGIIIDGAGIGSCIVANKLPGVRAGLAYDISSASNGREHNDANVLTLGAGLIGVNLAKQIVKTWLTTEFGGGRHAKRVNKIVAIEKQYLK